MRLSTRFTTAIIAHVVLTGAVFAALNYRVHEVAGMPGAAERFASLTKGLADELQASNGSLRPDVLALRRDPAVERIMHASMNGGIDPDDGTTLDARRSQFTASCVATLDADHRYRRCRMVGVADRRDIVSVERADGVIRI